MAKHLLPFHNHPLSCKENIEVDCRFCYRQKCASGIVYHCSECDVSLHKDCIDRFFNQPFLCNHFLNIVTSTSSLDSPNHRCHFRREVLRDVFAHCTICNIYLDLICVRHPPPLTISQPKHHKHSFTLLLRLVTFTCNACGVEGNRNPYVCLECNLMIHKECIDLPRVISINRHDHRISHTFHLGRGEGDWECGVCRKTIDWVYGAFTCSRCPSNYAVHSKCATRFEVWDGKELEDVPEEEEIIEDPFEVINETDIIHFLHDKHILRSDEDYVSDMHKRCEGCLLPINKDLYYKCVECDFILHKECASLPRKKRDLLHYHKLTLRVGNGKDDEGASEFLCKACRISFNGFRYECLHEDCFGHSKIYDVRCCSVSEPFHHYLHPHPLILYWTLEHSKLCKACGYEIKRPLSCIVCDYDLCIRCATLPRKVKHRCDDHFLSLCHDPGNSSGDLWCDICETKTDPSVCYYTCDQCGVSLHTHCVVGDFYCMKVGHVDTGLEVLANNGVTRPLCSRCQVRCKFPFLLRATTEESVRYICSIECGIPLSSSDED